nr:hypothetical protein [Rhizobium leguminosarum]
MMSPGSIAPISIAAEGLVSKLGLSPGLEKAKSATTLRVLVPKKLLSCGSFIAARRGRIATAARSSLGTIMASRKKSGLSASQMPFAASLASPPLLIDSSQFEPVLAASVRNLPRTI